VGSRDLERGWWSVAEVEREVGRSLLKRASEKGGRDEDDDDRFS
jgi:hypothetical protein